jgi:hypothetical protein
VGRLTDVVAFVALAVTAACANPPAAPCPEERPELVGTEALCPVIYPRDRSVIEAEMAEFGSLAGESDSPSDPVHYYGVVEDCFELACGLPPGSAELRAAEAKCFAGCTFVRMHFPTRAVPRGCPRRGPWR